MNSKESEFFEKLMATFREEAAEHIKALREGFLELEKDPPKEIRQQLVETVFREAHSLKGAARSVNQQNILEICQALETFFSLWKQNKIEVSTHAFDTLYAAVDLVHKALSNSIDPKDFSKILDQLSSLSKAFEEPPPIKKNSEAEEKNIPATVTEKTETKSAVSNQKTNGKMIRVSLQKMNHFFQEAEETLMIKVFFKMQLNQLQQLRSKLYRQEKEQGRLLANMQILRQEFQKDQSIESKDELNKNIFEAMEKQLHKMKSTREDFNKLLKNSEQNAHIVGTTIDKLLEDLKKILMQPMAMLFETLPLMIREIARDLSKEIRVEFQGENIEVDRRILEGIKDAVIHIIRNAIDHGIESPQERTKLNKPTFGTIRITATGSEGNHVKLSISDDGRGIDLIKIKQAALKKGFISQNEFETISDKDAIKLAFYSDISTSPIVTELSGRGLGLGIVSDKVDKLGGQTEVVTKKGEGTTFTLRLPLTLATFRGVHIVVRGQEFVVPTHNIERVFRIKSTDIKKAENRETVVLENRSFSFIHLADILGVQQTTTSPNKNFLFVLIVKAAEQSIAFGADDVHSEKEILVKGLGKQSLKIKNIMAATVLETGRVIPILNPIDLIKTSIDGEIQTSSIQPQDNQASKKSILLVEDSITTRLLFKNILSTANYEVKTAVDGLDALEILQSQTFDLIVSDIEMPRMDGFELLKKIRAIPQLKELPVIICSALGSNSDRKRGIELGANAYLDKNSYQIQSFLDIVKKLI